LPLITTPPDAALESGALNILDRNHDYRGYISVDGTCFNNRGKIIGYVSDSEAGSSDEQFLGELKVQMPDLCFLFDDKNNRVGELDLGKTTIKDENDVTVCEINNAGECYGNKSTFLGQFEGMTYHDMKKISLYLLLIDIGMLNEVEG